MTKVFPFQKDGVRAIQGFGGRALLADDMGLGKSLQALEWARRKRSARPIVVVCPAGLKWNWEHEALIHVNMRAEVLEGMKVPKGNGFQTPHELIIVNYDILGAWLEWLQQLDPQVVIIDESHYVKSPRAKRTKNVRALCKRVPHVIALSGTPLTNRPAELWTTLNIVRPDLYKSWFEFGSRYCKPQYTPWGIQYKGATHLDELHERLAQDMMIRRRKRDVLQDLPDKSRHVVLLPIDDRAQYRMAVSDFIGWLKTVNKSKARRVKRAQRLVRMGYLKRLIAKLKHTYVLQWIEDFLVDTDEKLVVFGIHRKMLSVIVDRFKQQAVLVNGEVNSRDRKLAVRRFQDHDKCRLFVGNIQAAGVGLNLTAGSTVAFVELGWTPGEHIQAEDRIHRIGQQNAAQVFYLVASRTIEQDLCKILQEKQSVLDAVLDDGGGSESDLDIYTLLERELLK